MLASALHAEYNVMKCYGGRNEEQVWILKMNLGRRSFEGEFSLLIRNHFYISMCYERMFILESAWQIKYENNFQAN